MTEWKVDAIINLLSIGIMIEIGSNSAYPVLNSPNSQSHGFTYPELLSFSEHDDHSTGHRDLMLLNSPKNPYPSCADR